jgi:hypothetical protein
VQDGGETIERRVCCAGLHLLPATNRRANKTENIFLDTFSWKVDSHTACQNIIWKVSY